MDKFLAESTEPLYRFLLRMTGDRELAADLTQEAIVRAWRRRKSLREQQARRVWLFRIAVNLCKDARRRRSATQTTSVDLDGQPACLASPDELASQREQERRVREALDALPPRQRETMHLHIFEQLAPREIAVVLDLDANAVRSNLAAARKRLRAQFPEWADPSERAKRPTASRSNEGGTT